MSANVSGTIDCTKRHCMNFLTTVPGGKPSEDCLAVVKLNVAFGLEGWIL